MTDEGPIDEKGYPVPGRMWRRGWRPNPPRPMDAKRKAKFLEVLALTGIVGDAARRASLHSHHGCEASFYAERKKDPEFAQAWDAAIGQARAAVEAELHRRAVDGVDEPVYWQGKKVGSIKKYSDTLLLARIRKLDPEYRQTHQVNHGGTINVQPIGIESLTKTQRQHLRAILTEQAKIEEATIVEATLLTDNADGGELSPPEEPQDGQEPE